ncbi:UbiH/UbiF/VisC/COQ6 family ubiquinone biosynthesis hydroxylase [Sinimarinibacterium sp. NLF-5-8]|uniref:UbiH/UbiF/VisC/COQ6 family ubiquinone biosynthesis hydroxylase n=1 Tax=Sinimarinibacterium sp. NLF-5-8 TaxID=2698684 RepID=UPI00137BB826|nr:UbiH/UbiF/VisC/COQ6 family ubiquinone biosynthesis hydroxylase [Sinimarinibacterium sp. NLF-5-8]QHS10123.1 UbiH/UbiF/VisC/COQ6 family ubiquinone biosynthesis hydroxylase [Sinimarinibacterium sp. NLF-5-8]
MNMDPRLDCDVAIVGAGLVGLATALGLHRAGLRVRVLDRGLPPPLADDYDLRVFAISPASARFLHQLGVWDAVCAERASAYRHMQVWETAPEAALHFDAADLHRDDLGHIVESRVLQRHLLAALPSGTLQQNVTVRAVDAQPQHAVLQLERGASLRAALIVAADSARSPLRSARGIAVHQQAYAQTAVVCHVRSARAHQATAYQRFLETGPVALLPLADGRSSVVWSSTHAEPLLAMDDASFCTALGDATQQVLGRIEQCTRRLSFPLAVLNAERYHDDRLVLAGDAAHVVHPLAGQGVNLGFGDAQELVGAISQARRQARDIGSARVLARYNRARQAAAQDMIAVTDGLYHAYQLQHPAWNWLRQTGLQAVNATTPLRTALIRRACGL